MKLSLPRWRKRGAQDMASLGNVRPLSHWRRRMVLFAIYASVVALCTVLDPNTKKPSTGKVGSFDSSEVSLFENAEQSLYGRRMEIYTRRHSDIATWLRKQIVLVPLSDETFDKDWGQIPGPPAPRDYQAKVVRELTRAGAKGIVFDMAFEDAKNQRTDEEFASALRDSGHAVIGSWYSEEDRIFVPPIPIFKSAARVASVLVQQGASQSIIDRMMPVQETWERAPKEREAPKNGEAPKKKGDTLPSLSLAGAMLAAGLGKEPLKKLPEGWKIGDFFLPVDESNSFKITFWGRPSNSNNETDSGRTDENRGFFTSVPYEQIYEGAVDDPFYKQNHFFKDKIILIGDITKLGNDFRLTSRGQMAGMEIQAHAMATLLAAMKKDLPLLHESPDWLNFLMIALLAALTCWFAATWRLHTAAIAMIVTLFGYWGFNIWIFTEHSQYLHVIAPSVAVFLTAMGVLGVRIFSEERQKTWMRGLLQRYVSPQVADYLVAHPEKLNLGGEIVNATVLFSDIRGFTAISRRFEAQMIVGLLNEYLQAMTDVIFAYDGTLDKYMGDGIMVIFGAPEPYEDHARRAVAVAIDMQTAMAKLRDNWGERGLPMLDIGVGIATGPMISGNMGSTQRTEMTVIGDTVNLSSRIEGLNKEIGTKLLIHESTYAVVQSEIEARGPIALPVKGHDEDVIVYEVFGWKTVNKG